MRSSDGRISIAPPGNPEDYIPGTPGDSLLGRPDRSGPAERPAETGPVEFTRIGPDGTLHIQCAKNPVTPATVNILLRRAKAKRDITSVVLYVSQETMLDQSGWLEKLGYRQEMQTNPRSSQFVMRGPAKELED